MLICGDQPRSERQVRLGAAVAQLRHRVLQHLLVELDPDLADMARLLVAQQIAAAADVQIVAGQLEPGAQAVQGLQHLQALLRRGRDRPLEGRGQIGVGPRLGPPHPAAQLVELRARPNMSARWTIRVLAVGTSRPELDDGGGQQHVVAAVVEGAHHVLQLGRRQLAVADDELHLRHLLAQELLQVGQVADAGRDVVGLAAAILLAQQGLADRSPGPTG